MVVEEVERLLRGLPGVDEVAVLGVPHPRLGQVLTAVVVGSAADGTLARSGGRDAGALASAALAARGRLCHAPPAASFAVTRYRISSRS